MVAGIQVQRRELLRLVIEIVQHLAHLVVGDVPQLGHFLADFLHFAGGQMLEYLGGTVFIQGQ